MSKVIELTNKDFDGIQLKNHKNKIVLIKFYTTWCGFCIRSIPEYENLANELKDDKNFVIAQIDCDKYKDTIDMINSFNYGLKIRGYPTIAIFKNGKYLKLYEDKREIANYLNALYSI